MDKVAVVIPCFNEEATIVKVVRNVREELPEASIYVYDNGSTDLSLIMALTSGAKVRLVPQRGKGYVIQQIFKDINAQYTLMIDGDDTYDVRCLKPMLNALSTKQCDMVVANRMTPQYAQSKQPFCHKFGNHFINKYLSQRYQTTIKDTLSGCRGFSHHFMTYQPVSKGFTIETELTLHALNNHLPVFFVDTDYRQREHGTSKINLLKDGCAILWMLLTYTHDNYQKTFIFN